MTEPIAIILAAIIATSASLITLVVQVISLGLQSRWIDKQSKLTENLEKKREIRERLQEQLAEFYNPIHTLLAVNRDIFERTGPKSVRKDEDPYVANEKKAVWDELVDNVVIKNNEKICNIIENKLHLLWKDDIIKPYLTFTTHARAYQIYRKQPFEDYLANFGFPVGFLEHVDKNRDSLYKEFLNQMEARN